MLQINVLCVGKIKEKYLQEGIKEYLKRLSSYVKLTITEISDEPCPENLSAAEINQVKGKEGDRLLKQLGPQDYMILLDLKGKSLSSPGLAHMLDDLTVRGKSHVAFVIGGSLGVSNEVEKQADFRWSISELTFPHQLVRLMLLEQIYRAQKINRNETYHK